MNHAFLILCYTKPASVLRLIRQLDSEKSRFYLHINKRSTVYTDEVVAQLTANPHVTVIPEHIPVMWGGFSLIRAVLLLIKAALKNEKIAYMHLLSESCYPVRATRDIFDFFEKNNGKEYLTFEKLPSKNWPYGGLFYIQFYSLYDIIDVKKGTLNWHINKRFVHLQRNLRLKRSLTPYIQNYAGGRAPWWSLSREALAFCMERIDNIPDFYKKFSHTFCLEEILFQTLLVGSAFEDKLVNDDLRYLIKETRNGNNPANLDMSDLDKMLSSNKLFARKFESPVSDEVFQKVQEHLDGQRP